MKNINFSQVEEAKDFELLPVGGYVCKILRVEDHPDREYLRIEFDIVEGDRKDYFLDNAFGDYWAGNFIKSYKEKALPFFKRMLTAVENSNKGFSADGFSDEKELIGQLIGLTIGHEKYWNGNGQERTRIYVDQPRSVEAIRAGKFRMPKDKVNEYNKPIDTLPEMPEDDSDIPF